MYNKDLATFDLLPKRHWVALGLTSLFVVSLFILIPVTNEIDRRSYVYQLPVPIKAEGKTNDETHWNLKEIKPGDNLAQLFNQASVSSQELYQLTQTTHGDKLSQLHPKDKVGFKLTEDGKLDSFRLQKSLFESYEYSLDKANNHYVSRVVTSTPDVMETFTEGTINSSLFEAGIDAGLSNNLIMKLATIFGWDIDFALDIREGDRFSLIYEEKYLDGKKVGDGDILVARFSTRGNDYTAIRYEDDKGNSQYYDPNGLSMRKAFLRSPVDFTRISSRFNLKRKHPILHKLRAHKGVDYAAARGTPIKAAGDGKVIFAGRKGGYGNVLILQHGSTYTTLYAHLNAFRRGIKVGKRVKQGQTVAYVGSTGLASGPHLHYEFRVNGAHRNPLTVRLPNARPINNGKKEHFLQYAQVMIMRLEGHLYGDYFAQN